MKETLTTVQTSSLGMMMTPRHQSSPGTTLNVRLRWISINSTISNHSRQMGISCTKNVFGDGGHKDIPSLPLSTALQCSACATDRHCVCHCSALNRLSTPEPGREDQRHKPLPVRGMILGRCHLEGARFPALGSPAGRQRGIGKRHVMSAGEYRDGFHLRSSSSDSV